MNVLVFVGSLPGGTPSGVVRYAINLVGALARRPHTRVTVLGDASALAPYERLPSVILIDQADIDSDRPTLQQHDFLIQVHQFQSRPLDLPTVVVVHDLTVHDAAWMYGDERAPLVRALHKNVIRAHAVVSGYPYVVDRLVALEPLATGKTLLTVSPSFTTCTEPDAATIADVRQRFGLNGGRPTVVYPAALQSHKNHWNLLAAVDQLNRSGLELQLLCIGNAVEADWAEPIRRRAAYLGLENVRFPGCVVGATRSALLRQITGVVSPSLAEAGAAVAQEALVSNAAVACSAIPGALAHLDRMRLGVPTFDPFDIDAIAAAIARLLDDAEGIVAGYVDARKVVDEWTWERLADEIVSSVEVVGS